MKTLAKLILIAGIGLSSLGLSAQDFKFPHETNMFKFFSPETGPFEEVVVNTPNGLRSGLWYNKDCKSDKDYQKKFEENGKAFPHDEVYVDMDEDGILDGRLDELEKLYNDYIEEKELEKTNL